MDRVTAPETRRQVWRLPGRTIWTIFRGLGSGLFLLNAAFNLFPWPPESLLRTFLGIAFIGMSAHFAIHAISTWRSGGREIALELADGHQELLDHWAAVEESRG